MQVNIQVCSAKIIPKSHKNKNLGQLLLEVKLLILHGVAADLEHMSQDIMHQWQIHQDQKHPDSKIAFTCSMAIHSLDFAL